MTFGRSPRCMVCKHYIRPFICAAFPEKIPDDILGGKDHSVPYPGDNGIMYEPQDMDILRKMYPKSSDEGLAIMLEDRKKFRTPTEEI